MNEITGILNNNDGKASKHKFDIRIIWIMLASVIYGLHTMNVDLHFNTVASIILLFVLITLPPDKDIYVYASLIPFYTLIPQDSPMRLAFFFLVSIVKIFLKNGSRIERKYILYFLVWFMCEVILDLFYAASEIDFTIIVLMLYFAVYMAKCKSADAETGKNITVIMIFSFAASIVFTALISDIPLVDYLQSTNEEIRFGEGARILGGAMDLPIYCAVSLSLVLSIFVSNGHSSIVNNIIYILLICTSIVFGALTVSRSFIFAIAIIFLWTYFSLITDSQYRKRIIPITFLVIAASVVLFWNSREAILNIITKYAQRSFFATSRTDVYSDCFDYLLTHPLNMLFGTGAFGYHKYGIEHNLAFKMFAHNLILDAIMSWGIVGTTAFGAMIFSYHNEIRKSYGKRNMIQYLPLVAWFGIMMTGGTFNYVEPYFYLLILIKMPFTFNTSKENQQNG